MKIMVAMLFLKNMIMSLCPEYQLRCCAVCAGSVNLATLRFGQFLLLFFSLFF